MEFEHLLLWPLGQDPVTTRVWTGRYLQPAGLQFTSPAPVHHLRGLARTGFAAQTNDGISLLDLTEDIGTHFTALGTFDTSFLSHPAHPSGNFIQNVFDNYLGTWDVAPRQDSGLVYASGGTIKALIFLVKQGQVNRYGPATPFPTGAAAAGKVPKLVARYGPPRAGRIFTLIDANKGSYPTTSAAGPVSYQYRILYALDNNEPTAAQVPLPGWTPTFISNAQNQGYLNLNQSPGFYVTAPNTDGVFSFPLGSQVGQRLFGQLVVEELVNGGLTGKWAASRGTWFGAAVP
jgi:hypothetical protein